MNKRITLKCKNCGNDFITQISQINKGSKSRSSCSKKCSLEYIRKQRIEKECLFCKKIFSVANGLKEKKFCCKDCDNKYRKNIRMGSERMMGDKNPMWKGGDSNKERRNADYKDWRLSVFKRDNFTCQECGYYHGDGTKRKDLNAHHIIHWINSIELRYTIDNGITLCVPCHINEHRNTNRTA